MFAKNVCKKCVLQYYFRHLVCNCCCCLRAGIMENICFFRAATMSYVVRRALKMLHQHPPTPPQMPMWNPSAEPLSGKPNTKSKTNDEYSIQYDPYFGCWGGPGAVRVFGLTCWVWGAVWDQGGTL